MAEPFVGQIISVGFPFAPIGYLLCNGATVPISTYTTLCNLLGTTYGGDGVNTFGLPNLNGRVPLGQGSGLGLSSYVMGQQVGVEQVTLTQNTMPAHSHTVSFSSLNAASASPKPIGTANMAMGTNVLAVPPFYVSGKTASVALNGNAITLTGGSQPHENRQQFLTLNYIIAFEGIYPTQG